MKKGFIAIITMALFAAVAVLGGLAMAAKTKSGEVKDEFIIKDPAFKKHKKVGVKFTHTAHIEKHKVKCTECHHVYKAKKNTWKEGDKVKKCSECHKPKKKVAGALKLKNAFHKNCQTCHKKIKKGPRKCKECHPKK